MLPERKLGAMVISIKIKEYKKISKVQKQYLNIRRRNKNLNIKSLEIQKKKKMFLKLLLHIATSSFELRVCFCQKPKLLAEF